MCENLNLGEKGNLGGEMIEETDSLEKLSLEDEIYSVRNGGRVHPPPITDRILLQLLESHCPFVGCSVRHVFNPSEADVVMLVVD